MKTPLALAAGLILSCQLSTAWPEVYQWKDSSGRTIISDTPPPAGIKDSRSVETDPAPDKAKAPKTTAEKEMEFRKRQQANREKSDKEAKELATGQEQKENCERAKRQLSSLESGDRMVSREDGSTKRYLGEAERQQEIERTRKFLADSCSK